VSEWCSVDTVVEVDISDVWVLSVKASFVGVVLISIGFCLMLNVVRLMIRRALPEAWRESVLGLLRAARCDA